MASTTISGGYTIGVTLTNPSYSQVYVTGTIDVTSGDALTGTTAAQWTVTNSGLILSEDTAPNTYGVLLQTAGSLINLTSGTIAGSGGVKVNGGAATVMNYGSITGSAGNAIYLSAGGLLSNVSGGVITAYQNGVKLGGTSATVVNAGSIIATLGVGINDQTLNSEITNQSGGLIKGESDGVFAGGVVTVTNAGSIDGYATGVFLGTPGDALVNQSAGTISGRAYGVAAHYGTDTISNAGSIHGGTFAVKFEAYGGNRLIVYPGASFSGLVDGGNTIGSTTVSTLELASGASAGTLSGLGSQFVDFAAIQLDGGATWTLAGASTLVAGVTLTDAPGTLVVDGTLDNGGSIGTTVSLAGNAVLINEASGIISAASAAVVGHDAPGTVINDGSIIGGGGGNGVALYAGGVITNHAGLIEGYNGVGVASAYGAVSNAGTIIGTSRQGVGLGAGGSVGNTGLISGNTGVYVGGGAGTVTNSSTISGTGRNGVGLYDGGTITNNGGLIEGYNAVGVAAQQGTIINSGTLIGTTRQGAGLGHGGIISNTGLIEGETGVYVGGGSGTVTNAGTISASSDAVQFAPNFAGDRLVIYPGAAFTGLVDGANTIGSTFISTLELASGTSAGTISGIGSKYTHFAQIDIDAGATWVVSGYNSISAGMSVSNAGFLSDGGTLVNAGVIAGSGTRGGVYIALGAAPLVNYGTISGSYGATSGDDATLTNASGGMIAGTDIGIELSGTNDVAVNAGTMTGGSAFGAYLVGGSLTNANGGFIYGAQTGVNFGGTGNEYAQNAGVIQGGSVGVLVGGLGGTVINSGTITGTASEGVALEHGGTLINQAGAYISGGSAGVLEAVASASIVNQAGAIIESAVYGVRADYGGTLVNAGVIGGSVKAVAFVAGHADRVAIYPGAVFSGIVDGGNTVGSTIVSTLELASGASVGTLSSLGSHYIDFGAITIDAGAAWTLASAALGSGYSIIDDGTLTNTGSVGSAVTLDNGAVFSNTSGATAGDTAAIYGIELLHSSSVTNQSGGTLVGSTGVLLAGGAYGSDDTLVNAGLVQSNGGDAVLIGGNGTLVNLSTGTITSPNDAIYATPGTVENAGTIIGGADAVRFTSGRLMIDPGAVFVGNVSGGATLNANSTLELAPGTSAGTLDGLGAQFVNFASIVVDPGASWTLTADTIGSGYTIFDGGTLTNTGTILSGVTLASYASLINMTGGTIAAYNAVTAGSFVTVINQAGGLIEGGYTGIGVGFGGTLVNAGSISANGTHYATGVIGNGGYLTNQSSGTISGAFVGVAGLGGIVVNAGLIESTGSGSFGYPPPSGVYLAGASLTNQAGGTISGYAGLGGGFFGGPGNNTVVNDGTISGFFGVALSREGVVTNRADGVIAGYGPFAVDIGHGATLENAGSIRGAVTLASGYTNRLAIDPGAYFSTTVDGGNTTGSGFLSTLELASGASVGTLSGLGSQFIHFQSIAVDAGASWSFAGYNSIALYQSFLVKGSLTNVGTLAAYVAVTSGGFFDNAAGATVVGHGYGAVYGRPGATVINAGVIDPAQYGVDLFPGGSVTNLASGTIVGSVAGVKGYAGAATVFNAGTIAGGTFAVTLAAGYANRVALYPGAVFSGTVAGGNTLGATVVSTLELASSAGIGTLSGGIGSEYVNFQDVAVDVGANWMLGGGIPSGVTLINSGTLGGSVANGVYLNAGATLTNTSSGTITATNEAVLGGGGPSTVVNAGSITSPLFGVDLNNGGYLINLSGGVIHGGRYGFAFHAAPATLDNAGSIDGGNDAVYMLAAASVTNRAGGTITANNVAVYGKIGAATLDNAGDIQGGVGVVIRSGLVINESSGTISGLSQGVQGNTTLTVINAGSIYGANHGLYLISDGTVTNQSGGSIGGGNIGVYMVHGTLFDSGAIAGVTQAVHFTNAHYDDRLVVYPGATFSGAVDGGNTLGSTYVSTLELATGASDGTLSGLGTQIYHFANVTIDAGASWTLAADALPGGYSVIDSGTLSNTGTLHSPVTVAGAALFSNAASGVISLTSTAIVGENGATVVNAGFVATGVNLANNALLINQGSGTIIGGFTGVYTSKAPSTTIDNYGLIFASTVGVLMQNGGGGSLTNASGGTISSGSYGVVVNGGTGVVVNAGSIYGAYGIKFRGGSTVFLNNLSGGVISGQLAVQFAESSYGSIDNAGSIGGTTDGIDLFSGGGTITNRSGGTVSGGSYGVAFGNASTTLDNAGSIYGGTDGVLVGGGGTVINRSGGAISAHSNVGVFAQGTAATIDNAGNISGAVGVYVQQGGLVINESSGTISGLAQGVQDNSMPLTLSNAGSIYGANHGLYLLSGGTVTNQSGGTISGGNVGVFMHVGTLLDAGAIVGSAVAAVQFYAGYSSRLVVYPGATFSGAVDGGNTLGATAVSTLELASGASAGTLSGLGTQIYHFANITIDAGATWTLTADALPAGYSIYDSGTLTNTGTLGFYIALGDNAALTNAASATIATGVTGAAAVVSNIIGHTATITNAGLIANTAAAATGYGIELGQGMVVNLAGATIAGPRGIDLIGNATLVNAGLVTGSAVNGYGASGGVVANQSSGTIAGTYGIESASTVVNAGLVSGSSDAVLFGLGANQRLVVYPNASFIGTVDGGNTIGSTYASTLELASAVAAGTLSGLGAQFINFASIVVDPGATWTLTSNALPAGYAIHDNGTLANTGSFGSAVTLGTAAVLSNVAGGVIATTGAAVVAYSGATVSNAGIIGGGIANSGIYLGGGGYVANLAGGVISGSYGIKAQNAPITVVNSGSITAGLIGIFDMPGGTIINQAGGVIASKAGVGGGISAALTVINAGSIYGSYGQNVYIGKGFLSNQSGGTISGPIGLYLGNYGATGVNAGVIEGSQEAVGVGGGTLINLASGTISGGTYGVRGHLDGAITVTNAGSIYGHTDAVRLPTGYNDRLIIDPGARFTGLVDGGNTAGSSYVSTLELASGATTGTISGIGSQFINFGSLVLDPGAQWVFEGDNTFAPGTTLIVSGSAANSATFTGEISLGAGAYFYNAPTGTIIGSGSFAVGGTSSGTVVNAGLIDPAQYGVYLAAGGSVTNLAGGTIVGTAAGVKAAGGAATVTNKGTIEGGTFAVTLGAGYANRVIFDLGAVFSGTVDGGNTIGATTASTLELASGASAGTLSGLGSQYIDFAHVAVDAGATWTVSGAVPSGVTLSNSGTLSGTGSYAVNLQAGAALTNATGGVIAGTSGVHGYAGSVTIDNAGSITGSGFGAVYLSGGGSVTNRTGGTISAPSEGIGSPALLTVTNDGLVAGEFGIMLTGGGTIANTSSGTISGVIAVDAHTVPTNTIINDGKVSGSSTGLALAGGVLTNNSDGTIISGGGGTGVYGYQAAVTVINAGSIGGANAAHLHGGYANLLIIDPGAVFSGYVNGGNTLGAPVASTLELASGTSAGTLTGLGSQYINFSQITVDAGAIWTLASDGLGAGYLVYDNGTLTNTGSIGATVTLGSGALLSNVAGAVITAAQYAVTAALAGASVANAGTIGGIVAIRLNQGGAVANVAGGLISGAANGVLVSHQAGTVSNAGSIFGTNAAVYLYAGGAVTNSAISSISAGGGQAIFINGVAGSVSNDGALRGGNAGILLNAGGTVTNQTDGFITASAIGGYGIVIRNGDGTVINAGTIAGYNGVQFATGYSNLLVVDPGASFSGPVNGANTLGSTAVSTLALASGASAGTLSGLGSQFINFADITVDPGATWTLTSDAIGSGYTITDFGTLTNTGSLGSTVYVRPGGMFTNVAGATIGNTGANIGVYDQGGVTNAGSVYGHSVGLVISNGVLTNLASGIISGGYGISGEQVALLNQGTITGQTIGVALYQINTVENAGTIAGVLDALQFSHNSSGGRLIIDPGAVFSGTVDGGNAVGASFLSTLELASGASAGTLSGLGVQFINFADVTIDAGANWTLVSDALGAGYTITDAGTLTNTGSIGSTVTLADGGALHNAAGAVISSSALAVYGLRDATVTLINAGSISGNGIDLDKGAVTNQAGATISGLGGVQVNDVATVLNAGRIVATATYGNAVNLNSHDASLTNLATGTINAVGYGVQSSGDVVNAGSIYGGKDGVYLNAGGLTNVAGAAISGGIGVKADAQNVAVINAGAISGSTDAVLFVSGYSSDRLIVDPGAVFSGTVDGGNTIGATVVSTLELAAGTSAGTLSGLGSQFINFTGITIDAGASWTFAADTLGSGYTIVDAGTLTNTGSLGSTVSLVHSAIFTNAAGATITSSATNSAPVVGFSSTVAVINAGLLSNTGGTYGYGVILYNSGVVTNVSGGTIAGPHGVDLNGNSTLVNAGLVIGSSANRGYGDTGGSVINQSGGTIFGADYGVGLFHSSPGTGTLVNAGLVSGGTHGVTISTAGGEVVNLAGGTISGATDAVLFRPGSGHLVVAYPGASFLGTVDGGNTIGSTAVSTLELASSASAGTLSGLGSQFIDFTHTTIDAGAAWTLAGANTVALLANYGGIVLDPSTLVAATLIGNGAVTIDAGSVLDALGTVGSSQTISFAGSGGYLHLYQPTSARAGVINFTIGDTIDLKGINPASVSYSAGTLSFTGGSFPLSLGGAGTLVATPSSDGAAIGVLCFCRDTMILTPWGERRVQDLAVGDLVTTENGAKRPIVWIGAGKVLATRGKRSAATPVIVRKGAIAPGVPSRDLHVTKGHSLFIDDVLIPAEFLVNHRSIVWDDKAQEVELYHIELEEHDVLIADGAPAESYRDDGNRWLFFNTNAGWEGQPREPCAPILTGGAIVDAVWRRLLDRAGPRPSVALTGDADLHLVVDGERIDASCVRGDVVTFRLPRRPQSVRIVSRSAIPDVLGLARDPRELGVALRRIILTHGRKLVLAEAEDGRLTDGFHLFEPHDAIRWTNGDALLPAALFNGFDGRVQIELTIAHTAQYPLVREAA